ncbi:MAG: carbohydrate kinase family protein [Clostridia bacterium]
MSKKIAVIGAVNMDICGKSNGTIIPFDSNLGKVSLSFGGVARNIAENLRKLNVDVSFLTAFGNDLFGREIQDHCLEIGMNLSLSQNFDYPTSTYLFVADENGEMQVAINDMTIYKKITTDIIATNLAEINSCDYVVLDTNYEKEVIEYICKNVTIPIVIDAVSIAKSKKLLDVLNKIDYLKPNKIEAEFLSNTKIVDEKSLRKSADTLLGLGVKNVLITLGEHGVYFANATTKQLVPAIKTAVVNSTGAGDSFVGGFVYGLANDYDVVTAVKLGVAASSITLQSNETVSPHMCEETLLKRI